MVCTTLLLLALVVTITLKLGQAAAEVAESVNLADFNWTAVADVLKTQDQTALFIVGGLMFLVWIFGVIDAVIKGLKPQDRGAA